MNDIMSIVICDLTYSLTKIADDGSAVFSGTNGRLRIATPVNVSTNAVVTGDFSQFPDPAKARRCCNTAAQRARGVS